MSGGDGSAVKGDSAPLTLRLICTVHDFYGDQSVFQKISLQIRQFHDRAKCFAINSLSLTAQGFRLLHRFHKLTKNQNYFDGQGLIRV